MRKRFVTRYQQVDRIKIAGRRCDACDAQPGDGPVSPRGRSIHRAPPPPSLTHDWHQFKTSFVPANPTLTAASSPAAPVATPSALRQGRFRGIESGSVLNPIRALIRNVEKSTPGSAPPRRTIRDKNGQRVNNGANASSQAIVTSAPASAASFAYLRNCSVAAVSASHPNKIVDPFSDWPTQRLPGRRNLRVPASLAATPVRATPVGTRAHPTTHERASGEARD